MSKELNEVLRGTIDGLSMLDVARLEHQCSAAEAMLEANTAVRPGAETMALKHTLQELLDSTDANLRLLRELRALRARGRRNHDDTSLNGGDRWVR